MRVKINSGDSGKRKTVSADLVKMNNKSAWVRLNDGTHIKRKLGRDYQPLEGDK